MPDDRTCPLPVISTDLTRHQRREKLLAIFREPEFFERLCDRVSSGATLYDIAKEIGVPYRWIYSYVNVDQERLDEYEMALEARSAMINDRVISGILGVSSADVRTIFKDDGELKQPHELDDATAAIVSSVDVTVDDRGKATKKIRLHDKMRSFELLGRHEKMFTDKVEHAGIVRLEDLVHASLGNGSGDPKAQS